MIDYAKVTIKAGDGGDGSVHFLREKFDLRGVLMVVMEVMEGLYMLR